MTSVVSDAPPLGRAAERAGRWLGALLVLAAAVLNLRDPLLPADNIDLSWVMATDHALRSGARFGVDYVFTYGPWFQLATRYFDPAGFGLVLAYDVLVVLLLCAPALINRSVGGLAAVVLGIFVLKPSTDALIMSAFLSVFLAALLRRDLWTLAAVAACGPLALSKLSFLLVLGPLLAVADLQGLRARRPPLLLPVLAAATAISLLAAGQSLADAPALAAASLEIVLGYGRAMQLPGDVEEVLAAVLLIGLSLVFAATALRPASAVGGAPAGPRAAAMLGFAWFLFIAFKAGFVRQDAHTAITFQALVLGLASLWGYAGRPFEGLDKPDLRRIQVTGALVLVGAVVAHADAVRTKNQSLLVAAADNLAQTVLGAPERLGVAAQWASGRRWDLMEARREAALAAMRRPFPAVVGSVDVVPDGLAAAIASGLDYRPRPVIQSYSAYTPGLQRRDLAHFQGPGAPHTLLLQLHDIDGRLPGLALGPSLAVIAARYDAVGRDPLGLVLHRRAAPRRVSERPLSDQPLPLNEWVPVPRAAGVVTGRIDVLPTAAGRAAGFLFREPVLTLRLRGAGGQTRAYRFVPGMARLGVALSPLAAEGADGALTMLDPDAAARGEAVAAMRIDGPEWAFADGRVGFYELEAESGFGARLLSAPGSSR